MPGSGTGTPIHLPGVNFVVQDEDTPTSTANAYISVAEFQDYHSNRNNTYSATESQIEVAIIKATDYVDARWTFAGLRYSEDQSTECPRQEVINEAGYWVSGLPMAFKQAVAEYALLALTQELMPNPTSDESNRKVQSYSKEIGGAISKSVTYIGGGQYQWPQYPLADKMMRRSELIANRGGELARG